MKKKRKILMVVIASISIMLNLIACASSEEIEIKTELTYAGIIQNMQVIPTSWNEDIKSRIETDKGIFIIYGSPSVFKGDSTYIKKFIGGTELNRLCFKSTGECFALR